MPPESLLPSLQQPTFTPYPESGNQN